MIVSHPLPIETLMELVRLDPDSGLLYWRERSATWFKDGKRAGRSPVDRAQMWNAANAGQIVPTWFDGMYRAGYLLGRKYRTHVVVFALANGHWPLEFIDHKDTDKLNNSSDNLRSATKRQNTLNRVPTKTGAPGVRGMAGKVSQYKGVVWDKHIGKWRVYINPQAYKRQYVGIFSDEVAAASAYDTAALQHYGAFARLNFPECRW